MCTGIGINYSYMDQHRALLKLEDVDKGLQGGMVIFRVNGRWDLAQSPRGDGMLQIANAPAAENLSDTPLFTTT